MILTKRCTYGLRALLRLVSVYPAGQLTGREIAEAEEIPKKFLDQLLLALANAGIVRSKKGNHGGYSLAQNPESLKISGILEVLSGAVLVAECMNPGYICSKKGKCAVQAMANDIQQKILEFFENLNLKQLSEKITSGLQLEYSI